jgi:hypothetical protein
MSQEVIEITEREIEIIEVVERGPAGPTGPQANINYTVVSSPQTLSNSQNIAADTSGGTFTLTLPLNPNEGDSIDIFDYSETFDTNPLTIARNGERIESIEENLVCNVEGAYFTMIYTGVTRGWQILPRYGTSGGGGESILTNQGDTLYRGPLVNERLPIGTAGQILKVNSTSTAPEWGAAPATGVTSVTGTAPIASSGGATPAISISAATTSAAGSMSSADKTKLDAITGTNTGDQTITLTGNVTGSGTGSFAATIANDAVDNTKLSNMAQSTIKGRATASTGDPEDLSASQVRTILNVADGAEVNVNADWDAVSGDAQILNKPTLGTASSRNIDAISDADLRIVGSSDSSKKIAFEVDTNVPTTSTVTLTAPAASGTLALLSDLILSKLNGTVVLAPTSDANTTSTTPASVAGMSFTAQANTNYLVIASLQLDVAASGGGCVLDASTPNINGGATANGIQCVNSSTTNALVAPSSTSIRAFRATAAQTSSGLVGAVFSISTVRFTAGGTVDFNWALVSSSANTSTLKSSSRVVLIPIT